MDLTRFESSPRIRGQDQYQKQHLSFEANFMDQNQIRENENSKAIGVEENDKIFVPQEEKSTVQNFEHFFNIGVNSVDKDKKIPLRKINFKKINPEKK